MPLDITYEVQRWPYKAPRLPTESLRGLSAAELRCQCGTPGKVAISTPEAGYQSRTRNAVKALLGSFPFHSRSPAMARPAVGAR